MEIQRIASGLVEGALKSYNIRTVVGTMGTIKLDIEVAVPLREAAAGSGCGLVSAPASRLHDDYQIIDYYLACQDRASIQTGFFQFVEPCFSTVAIFAVQSKSLKYIQGYGKGLHKEGRMAAAIAWMNGVLIRRTISQRMPYQGAIPMDIEEKQMFSQFLQTLPSRCWLHPVAIGDTVDCLIYADSPQMAPRLATQRLTFVTGKMVLALRRLLIEHLLVHG